ncbi:ABC transporter ATP-binding protein [Thermasporomyces composti]|uniref:Oligopeptide/dipeptide ABC transporter ATP-binding protein n=1 Tax=Thermasporomyces composti TaxID=696763 RepID=A0A3D9VA12_THECX|nr:ABC transporter ATP-binding protein [Thermasporomyces composti]REF38347.1 oligopeptide/dipeptide ABC transporter ATP-binding protein [Thermasporomyces composti]
MPTKPEPASRTAVAPAPSGVEITRPADILMDVRDLQVHYALRGSSFGRLLGAGGGVVKAVDGVTFQLRRGEVLGLVGESGSGKTTLGRALLGLVRPTGGQIRYDGQDLARMSERRLRPLRRNLQMVFQDPAAALNPSMDIETAVGDPLRIHKLARSASERRARVAEALERVGLTPVERFLSKYPSDLSGGQKQRAVLARAIVMGPELLVADEPVSMLDMSVRAKILELMLDLKRDLDLTYVYITHDLASAKFFCDRVAIMYLGRIVEIGPTEEIFTAPKHPYTQALLRAVPDPDPNATVPRDIPRGEVPDAAAPPLGCSFHPRCPKAFERCGWETRDLRAVLEQHWLTLDETRYEAERKTIGNLDSLDTPGHTARLTPGRGRQAADVAALVERLRQSNPDEPLWRGVRRVETDDGGVTVEFHQGEDPRLRPADGVDVACHLY